MSGLSGPPLILKKPLAVTASGFFNIPSYSFVTMGMIMGLRLVCL